MSLIPEVKDEEIFIKTNSLTNMIKSKKLRKQLLDLGIKVEIYKEFIPIYSYFGDVRKQITYVFYHPNCINKDIVNEIARKIINVIERRYDWGYCYKFVEC